MGQSLENVLEILTGGKKEIGPQELLVNQNKASILIVDDETIMRQGLYDRYSNTYNVILASGGEEALMLLKTHKVHTVILDVIMPNGIDGYATKERISTIDPYLPVTFLTAFPKQSPLKQVLKIYSPWSFLDKGIETDMARLDDIVKSAVEYFSQVLWDRGYIHKIKSGHPVDSLSLNIETIIGGAIRKDVWDNGFTLIKDFNDQKSVIGAMPDNSKAILDEAINHCYKAQEKWSTVSVKQRIKILKMAGEILGSSTVYDHVIPRTNLCARKIVIADRLSAAEWMKRTAEYLIDGPFRKEAIEHNLIRGEGTVGIFIQSSMYMTGAYGIIDAIRAGNSILLKVDSKDPYPQYQVALAIIEAWQDTVKRGEISGEMGPPIQIVSWDTTKSPELGQYVMRKMNKNIFMGAPDQLAMLLYGYRLKEMHLVGDYKLDKIDEIRQELMPPSNVIWYVSHYGAGYVHQDANIEEAVSQVVHSMSSHYRSCKRLHSLTVHPEIYDDFLITLKDKIACLKVCNTSDPVADIVLVSKEFWDGKIKSYLLKGAKLGRFVMDGDINAQGPKLLELGYPKEEGELQSYLGRECMYPVLNIIKGDSVQSRKIAKAMGKHQPGGKILEFSVWSSSPITFVEFYKAAECNEDFSWGYHHNQPTTLGLGNVFDDRLIPRDHERKWAVVELSRNMPYKNFN